MVRVRERGELTIVFSPLMPNSDIMRLPKRDALNISITTAVLISSAAAAAAVRVEEPLVLLAAPPAFGVLLVLLGDFVSRGLRRLLPAPTPCPLPLPLPLALPVPDPDLDPARSEAEPRALSTLLRSSVCMEAFLVVLPFF